MASGDNSSVKSGRDAAVEYGTDLALTLGAGVLAVLELPIAASVAALGALGLGATLVLSKAMDVYSAQASKFDVATTSGSISKSVPNAPTLTAADCAEASNENAETPVGTGAGVSPAVQANKKDQTQIVTDTQHAATQIENISEKTAKAKTRDDKTWLSSFVDINMVAGKAGANLANGLAGTFEGFVEKAKAGTLTVGDAFKALGAAIGQALLNAIGESLIQMGVADLTKGTGDLIKGNYATGGKEMAVGAAESAGGGAIKGLAAAFLADGGLVTQPTLAMVGEAGSPEGVIPLSKLGNLGGTNLSVNNLSMSFPGVSSQSDLSGSNFKSSAARQFIQIQQYANRRTGKRNA